MRIQQADELIYRGLRRGVGSSGVSAVTSLSTSAANLTLVCHRHWPIPPAGCSPYAYRTRSWVTSMTMRVCLVAVI